MEPEFRATSSIEHNPPWHLQGDAFILNYWLTPHFIRQAKAFDLASSPLGRMIQVLLVRYHSSPVGPYDELLIMDHPLLSKRVLTSIPKIYVSTEASMIHGQQLWGIPKQLAQFRWEEVDREVVCHVEYKGQTLTIDLKKTKSLRPFYVNSHHLPASMLTIRQKWQQQHFQFTPHFRGHICKLIHAHWNNTQDIFPDFSKAKYLQSFYVPKFDLVFPTARISH